MDLRDQLQSSLGSAYTLERELGGGGMSRVFVATETALGRRVVMKVLPAELAAGVNVDRFRREIQFAAQLQHPCIVPVLSAGVAEGLPFYTMPMIDGDSLRARLSRSGELSVSEAVKVLRDTASALAYAHEKGVVHRDIKPDNILLSAGYALVTDFGVAKAISASTSPDATGLTSLGVTLGTPAYMAPEQASADPLIDHRADLYAFGAMAYEMLSGQPPFAGRPLQAILAAHVNEVPEPLAKRRPSVPAPLVALVMRCLEKRAADRPQSAADVVHTLDAIVTPSGRIHAARGPRATNGGGRTWALPGARVAIAVLVILFVGAALVLWSRKAGQISAAKSIAVLPFRNLSAEKGSEFFSEGMTEEITQALARVPGLQVPARSTAAAAAAKEPDGRRVGEQLAVGAVLQGSVQRAGDRVHISAELIGVRDGFHLWSQTYDRELKDVFQVQDEIAKAIASALQVRLAGGASATLVRVATESPEAHTLYLQGVYLWNRRTAPTLRQAISYFEQAIAKDPRYAQPHAGIALAYAVLPTFGDMSTGDTVRKAKVAARGALAIDSTVVEAWAAIGWSEMLLWRNAEAEHAFRRAIALDSTYATAHQWYALLEAHLGRFDEALAELRRAHDLEPQSSIIRMSIGRVLYQAHRNADAERALHSALEFDPSFALTYSTMSLVLIAQGKNDDAISTIRRSIELFGATDSWREALLALAQAAGGHTAAARTLLQELVARSARGPVSATGMALLYDALGEREHALESLSKAVAEYDWPLHLESRSPLLDHLRADPRGAALLAKTEALNDTP